LAQFERTLEIAAPFQQPLIAAEQKVSQRGVNRIEIDLILEDRHFIPMPAVARSTKAFTTD